MSDSAGRVTLEIPAQAEHVAVLRAASAVIASRLNFSLDDIDDLRILIDEAASVMLSSGATGRIRCDIDVRDSAIHFQLFGTLPSGEEPHGEGFAWSIMNALAHEVSIGMSGDEHVISVTRSSGPVLDGAR